MQNTGKQVVAAIAPIGCPATRSGEGPPYKCERVQATSYDDGQLAGHKLKNTQRQFGAAASMRDHAAQINYNAGAYGATRAATHRLGQGRFIRNALRLTLGCRRFRLRWFRLGWFRLRWFRLDFEVV